MTFSLVPPTSEMLRLIVRAGECAQKYNEGSALTDADWPTIQTALLQIEALFNLDLRPEDTITPVPDVRLIEDGASPFLLSRTCISDEVYAIRQLCREFLDEPHPNMNLSMRQLLLELGAAAQRTLTKLETRA